MFNILNLVRFSSLPENKAAQPPASPSFSIEQIQQLSEVVLQTFTDQQVAKLSDVQRLELSYEQALVTTAQLFQEIVAKGAATPAQTEELERIMSALQTVEQSLSRDQLAKAEPRLQSAKELVMRTEQLGAFVKSIQTELNVLSSAQDAFIHPYLPRQMVGS